MLLDAAIHGKVLWIEYEAKKGKANNRRIKPVYLYANDGFWYCAAYCYLREGYRVFRCDRIRHAAVDESGEMEPLDPGKVRLDRRKPSEPMETVRLKAELSRVGVQRSAGERGGFEGTGRIEGRDTEEAFGAVGPIRINFDPLFSCASLAKRSNRQSAPTVCRRPHWNLTDGWRAGVRMRPRVPKPTRRPFQHPCSADDTAHEKPAGQIVPAGFRYRQPFMRISLAPNASAGSIWTAPEIGERVKRIPRASNSAAAASGSGTVRTTPRKP